MLLMIGVSDGDRIERTDSVNPLVHFSIMEFPIIQSFSCSRSATDFFKNTSHAVRITVISSDTLKRMKSRDKMLLLFQRTKKIVEHGKMKSLLLNLRVTPISSCHQSGRRIEPEDQHLDV
jgi:hypothetical protein